jgi:hypothetical protein
MAVTFANLYTQALGQLPGCPKALVMNRLYMGAQHFFRRSECWTYDQTQNVVADQTNYTLGFPGALTKLVLRRIKTVWYGTNSDRKQDSQIVDVDEYSLTDPATLVFLDAYGEAVTNGLTTRIVLVPTVADHEITTEMMDLWAEKGFLSWALMNLLNQKNKPCKRAVTDGKASANRQRKSGVARVVPRYFA